MTSLLQTLFTPLNSAFEAIPFSAARPLIVGFLVLAAIAPLFASKDFIFRGCTERPASRDLRYWALVAMIPYIVIYVVL